MGEPGFKTPDPPWPWTYHAPRRTPALILVGRD